MKYYYQHEGIMQNVQVYILNSCRRCLVGHLLCSHKASSSCLPVQVTVTHVDDTPLTEAERGRRLVVTHSHRPRDGNRWVDDIASDVVIPENGVLKLDFSFPMDSQSAKFYVCL